MAMPAPQWKPSRLDRQVAKFTRKQARMKSKQAEERKYRADETARRKQAFAREGGRCRATGVPLRLVTDNPLLLAHNHHIVFRSAGGSDELHNRIIVSPEIHDLIHRHIVSVEGDGNATVTFTRRSRETGDVERVWESER